MINEDIIKYWATITESRINEVSDIDVDWDDETLEKKIEQDYMKWA